MRMRTVGAALAATVLFVGLAAAPASAGTGPSQYCKDGAGYVGDGVTDPVTVTVEVSEHPANVGHQQVWVCYSTSATSTPGSIIGGAIFLDVYTNTTSYPGAWAAVYCAGDSGVSVGPLTCFVPNNVGIQPAEVSYVPSGGFCLVSVNGSCTHYVTGGGVNSDASGNPLLTITLAGVTVPVELPPTCIAVFDGSC